MLKAYKIGTKIIVYTFIFWLLYTIFFLIVDGWHWAAIRPEEKILDRITVILYSIGWFFYLISVIILVESVMDFIKFTVKLKKLTKEGERFKKIKEEIEAELRNQQP